MKSRRISIISIGFLIISFELSHQKFENVKADSFTFLISCFYMKIYNSKYLNVSKYYFIYKMWIYKKC